MNLMGRIFTLLILILSIAFLVVAVMVGASHRNWKEAATVNKEIADQSQRTAENARTKSGEKAKQLAAEQVARAFQLQQFESQLAIARRLRNDTQAQLREELVLSQQRMEQLKRAEQRLGELDKQVAELKTQNSKLIDDVATQRKQVVIKTSSVYKLEGEKDELETMVQDLTSINAQQTKVMKAKGITKDQLVSHIPPQVDGIVKGVSGNVIVISLGSDDGLRQDHVVDIFRGNRFVGKAKVLTVEPDISSARIIPEFQLSKVREGDHVTTKL